MVCGYSFASLSQPLRSERGLTILELLVVICMLGALAGIAIPMVVSYRQRAYDGIAIQNLRDGLTAQEAYYTGAETYLDCVGIECAAGLPSFRISDTVHIGFRAQPSIDGETVMGVGCSQRGSAGGKFYFRIVRVIAGDQLTSIEMADACSDEAISSFLHEQ